MARYIQFDDDDTPYQVASNSGWGDFCRWAQSLSGFRQLKAFCEFGECENVSALRSDLSAAMEMNPASDDVVDIGFQILHNCDAFGAASSAIITDGVAQEE